MKFGKLYPQTSVKYDGWEKIYETVLGSAASSVSITGLEGDTDEVYMLDCKFVNGYAGINNYRVRLNGDSASNYGFQELSGTDSAISASRGTDSGAAIGYDIALGTISQSSTLLYAKSGYVRTILSARSRGINGTTVDSITGWGWSWNNTSDEITSMTILGSGGVMAVGSVISLYRRISA